MSGSRQSSRGEYVADAIVHVAALVGAGIACFVLLRLVATAQRPELAIAVGIYLSGLTALAVASTLYNVTHGTAPTAVFQRIDHACIYIMIAGTYTPFCLLVIPAPWGGLLLLAVWALAVLGAAFRLAGVSVSDSLGTALYLATGWLVLLALPPLIANISGDGLVLLIGGGLLYTLGVVFYRWDGLPYRRAIWHGFVFAGATCHYFAVLNDVVLAHVSRA